MKHAQPQISIVPINLNKYSDLLKKNCQSLAPGGVGQVKDSRNHKNRLE